MPSAVVACASGNRLLLVPIRDGVGDLTRVAALNSSAQLLWKKVCSGAQRDDLVGMLVADAGLARERAEADVEAFTCDLAAWDLGSPNDVPLRGVRDVVTLPKGSSALEGLARAVLDQGFALRFEARGLSMRPQLPHGSTLEVAPRRFDDIRIGDIALYSVGEHRLVAHRVVARRGDLLQTCGDSAARRDVVDRAALIGVVTARIRGDGVRLRLDQARLRYRGLVSGFFHRGRVVLVRACVVQPLRRLPLLRRCLRSTFGLASRGLRFVEDKSAKLRRRVDVGRAALMRAAEKDVDRRRLYARKSIQDFTGLDENVDAGLTLIEEVLLQRHPIPPCRCLVLGCGPGRESLAMLKRGFDVTGIDREGAMLDRARAIVAREGLSGRFLLGEAEDFEVPGETFGLVVVFSGLYNMLLPRRRRVSMLESAFRHLDPGGRCLVTFLSDYCKQGAPAPPTARGFWSTVNPEHEDGDLYLLNEALHILPHSDALLEDARAAGFVVEALHRDQRAYDRSTRQVRGYAVLVRP